MEDCGAAAPYKPDSPVGTGTTLGMIQGTRHCARHLV